MNRYRKELSIDLYEMTMSQVFWRRRMAGRATFSLFFRGYPPNRSYYVASGIDDALDSLENFHFSDDDIQAIRDNTHLSPEFIDYLADVRFNGSVRAVSEGEIVFANEPVLEVTGTLIETQLVETMLLNIITSASLFATKASRIVQAAGGKAVVDFGTRRSHSEESALLAAHYGYIAGFTGTSNVKAAAIFGIPALGTMAHSYIQAFNDETAAFEAYAQEFGIETTLLVDTYDTLTGVKNTIRVAKAAEKRGLTVNSIRLDSGDLGALAVAARAMLDDAGLPKIRIIASGGLDEYSIADLVASGAPIDAYGVGTRYGTSADAPYIDSVYKLVELDGRPVMKRSVGKATLGWEKQVYRRIDNGMMTGDVITRASAQGPDGYAAPLLSTAMHSGKRMRTREAIDTIRQRVSQNIQSLPAEYRALGAPIEYPVEVDGSLTSP